MAATPLPETLTESQILAALKPGDCLLYHPQKFDWKHLGTIFGGLIRFKTWRDISHCELYLGKGTSGASRDGKGVAVYPLRTAQLAYILRPNAPSLDWVAFWAWFRTVNGQPYDWVGLLRFAWFKEIPAGNNNKMFCSEWLTRAYRALAAKVFTPDVDADSIAPGEFLLSPNLTPVMIEAPVVRAA